MGLQVVNGAQIMCSFGTEPQSLSVSSQEACKSSGELAATIMDFAPETNIPAFGECSSLANPTVASATASAAGVLTPQDCVPATTAPWTPGSPTHLINNFPALNNSSMCMCMWAGVITITDPGQTTEEIP